MKFSQTLIASALLASAALVHAESPFSANIALTSDYMFRGVSQTDDNPAIQGGFDFNHESGLYIGTWASNVDFAGSGSSEHDVYIGFSKDADNGVGFDVGMIRFIYPGSDVNLDYNEYYGSLSFSMDKVTLSGGIYYSNDVFATDETGIYYTGSVEVGVTDQVKVNAGVGLYDFDANVFGPTVGADSYVDWKLGVAAEVEGWGFDLSYVDTNDDGETLFGDAADGRVVFTVSKSL